MPPFLHSFIHCVVQKPVVGICYRAGIGLDLGGLENGGRVGVSLRSSPAWTDFRFPAQPTLSNYPPSQTASSRCKLGAGPWVAYSDGHFLSQAPSPPGGGIAREGPKCGGTRYRVCFVGVEFLEPLRMETTIGKGWVGWEKPWGNWVLGGEPGF